MREALNATSLSLCDRFACLSLTEESFLPSHRVRRLELIVERYARAYIQYNVIWFMGKPTHWLLRSTLNKAPHMNNESGRL